jgi:hypothetical protein
VNPDPPLRFHEYRSRVIRHELGHWIVARMLGFDVGGISIEILAGSHGSLGHQGSAKLFPLPAFSTLEDVLRYTEDRIAILFAGVAAQAMFETGIDAAGIDALMATDGSVDRSNIQELLHIARAIAHPGSRTRDNEPEQINAIGERCWRRACEMLETHRTRISAMATHLRKETVARNVEYTFTAEQLDAWWSMTGTSSISAR